MSEGIAAAAARPHSVLCHADCEPPQPPAMHPGAGRPRMIEVGRDGTAADLWGEARRTWLAGFGQSGR